MYGVVAGGPGLVAVGYEADGIEKNAAVWTSVDGLTWRRVRRGEAVFGGPDDQVMGNSGRRSGSGRRLGHDESGGDWDAAVWTSVDGLTGGGSSTMRRSSAVLTPSG
jgi:hypothetical protein